MIPCKTMIAYFQRMLDEGWKYTWGANDKGNVDCSGAFVWAYRQEGKSIYNGSNRIARDYVVKLLPVSEAAPGMAAFKLRTPGETNYALPQGYQPGGGRYNGDLNDYYHIGLVDADPRYVLNAKSPADGFSRDSITKGWDCVARLLAVDYGEGQNAKEDDIMMAIVTAPNGSTVNLRMRPSTKGNLVDRVLVGASVQVLSTGLNDKGEEWSRVGWDGRTGYMMTQYLRMQDVPEKPQESPSAEADKITVSLPKSAAMAIYEALGGAL